MKYNLIPYARFTIVTGLSMVELENSLRQHIAPRSHRRKTIMSEIHKNYTGTISGESNTFEMMRISFYDSTGPRLKTLIPVITGRFSRCSGKTTVRLSLIHI